MLQEEKIHTMSKLAIFEQHEKKDALRMAKYYRIDYIRYEFLKNIISVTVAYAIILAMIAIYHMEHLLLEATKLDYILLRKQVLGGYIILLVVSGILTFLLSGIKYYKNHRKIKKYYHLLRVLRQGYRDERKKTEEMLRN